MQRATLVAVAGANLLAIAGTTGVFVARSRFSLLKRSRVVGVVASAVALGLVVVASVAVMMLLFDAVLDRLANHGLGTLGIRFAHLGPPTLYSPLLTVPLTWLVLRLVKPR